MRVLLYWKLCVAATLCVGLVGAQNEDTSIEVSETITSSNPEVSPAPDPEVIPTITLDETTETTAPPDQPTETSPTITSEPGSLDTETLTPTPTDFTSSTGTPGNSTSSSASATSSSESEGDEITEADPLEGAESTKAIPPDVTTPEQHAAEENENKPETAINDQDAKELAVMETVLFEHFVQNSPAPGDAGKIVIPANVSECSVKRSLFAGSENLGRYQPRSLRGYGGCKFVTELDFDIHFHYIKETRDGLRPENLGKRVQGSMEYLKTAYGPLGITFNHQGGYKEWRPPATGANSDWSVIIKNEARLQRWQKKTHTGNKMTLNIWMVNDLVRTDASQFNGYATFPEDQKGTLDGVVLDQKRLQLTGSVTLIHEIGHWLGLQHTFGRVTTDQSRDCQVDDGLLDTTLTPGLKPELYACEQYSCDGSGSAPVYSWMSYSSCRGRVPAEGFTTDQKAAMFARAVKWRRGYLESECEPVDPGVVKRSSMQDLVDGKCPDISAQVQAIQSQPTKAPDVVTESGTGSGTGSKTGAKNSSSKSFMPYSMPVACMIAAAWLVGR